MLQHNATTPSEGVHVDNLDAALNGARATKVSHCGNGSGEGVTGEQVASTLASMQSVKRWLLWREIPNQKKPKPDKVPYYIDGSLRGKTDTSEDWSRLSTYADAVAILQSSNGLFKGLAFALGADGTGFYWQGIDFDEVEQNQLSDLANYVVGYVELSPSEKGCHAIGYGRHFDALGSNGTGIEAYSSGRFFTVTERMIRDAPIRCLATFVEQYLAPRHNRQKSIVNSFGTDYVDHKTVTELRSALNAIPADDYHVWVAMGCALKSVPSGRELWITWSQTSTKWNPTDAMKWMTFSNDRTGYQAVFAEAQRNGWVNPSSKEAQIALLQEVEQPAEKLFAELSFDWDIVEPLPKDLVDGLVADEEVTLLGGHGGIGKGFLSLQLAFAVALGGQVLGHDSRQNRVLYYSAEDGRKRIGHRLRALQETYDDDERSIVKRNLRIIDASDLDPLYGENKGWRGVLQDFHKLQKMVESFDPQLVVIDGASDTFDGNEIGRREVRGFIKALRRIHPKRRVGVLLIVHIDRSSARGRTTDDDGYSGSSQWHNSCRRRLYLQRKVEKDEQTKEEIDESIILRVMKNQDGPPEPEKEVLRQKNGFWRLAIDISAFVSVAKQDYAPVILRLITDYYRRGQWISTSLAPNETTGVYGVLKCDPEFPPKLNKNRTHDVVMQLQREGKLVCEAYRRAGRGGGAERWKPA